jgi:DNA-binding NtrC family response regulator
MNHNADTDVLAAPSPLEDPTLELAAAADGGPWGVEIGSPNDSQVVALEAGQSVVLGTSTTADVKLEDRTVSAVHARLVATPFGVTIEDLGSRNGVFVAGARVSDARLSGKASSFVVGRTVVTVRALSESFTDVLRVADPVPGVVGDSLPMRRLSAQIRRCAPLRAPVLLLGESGSGKDVVARAIHVLSRRSGQYLPINVGTIPGALADAELFGHRRGAFTGAVTARPGAFEAAHRGTLFLDEIAELDPAIQVKLLRVVEERKVRPLGSAQSIDTDVRIVSATWAPLEERVDDGAFREDLYHRISTFVVRIPPLRYRKSDIALLSTALLARIRDEVGPKELQSAGLSRLVNHSWPGNVRELGSVLYRAAASADSGQLGAAEIEGALTTPARSRPRALSPSEARAVLDEHGGNVSAASRAAGVPRSTFRSWLEKAPV